MPTSSDSGLTVQQRIIEALDTKIVALEDGGSSVFRKVYRGDLDDMDNIPLPAASIDFGTEELVDTYGGCNVYMWPLFFHFRYRGERGLDEHDKFLYYLGILKMAVLGDHNLGGLTDNMIEDSNAHTIIGIEDALPGGTLVVIAKYRTRLHNPYKLITEAP